MYFERKEIMDDDNCIDDGIDEAVGDEVMKRNAIDIPFISYSI